MDVRIIAATNRNLRALVDEGKFRKDLFYRLSVLPVFIPPLCERAGDVPLLARHFLRRSRMRDRLYALLKKQHLRQLDEYAWPGNVRELENVMERFVAACAMGDPPDMAAILEPEREWDALGSAKETVPVSLSPEQRAERVGIALALRHCNGRRGEAAGMLGMNRTTLFRKMSRYGMV